MSVAAVFSDVEGTLIADSIPQMFLTIGQSKGIFTPTQRIIVRGFDISKRLLPAKLQRQVQIVSVLFAVAGHTPTELDPIFTTFIPRALQKTKPATLRRLQTHQEAGLPLVLLSAGMHEAIARLGAELGGRGEGTRLRMRDGRFLAHIDGRLCQGEGKAERARMLLAELDYDPAQSYAYGDTASDIPFLALFGHPCAVDPDARLAVEAAQRGWPILLTGGAQE